MVAAFIELPSRWKESIFGRSLLERLLIVCERAAVRRFFLQAPESERDELAASMGALRSCLDVIVVSSIAELVDRIPPDAFCIAIRGNPVITSPQLLSALASQAAHPGEVVELIAAGAAASVAVGPLELLLRTAGGSLRRAPAGQLTHALDGRAGDLRRAEVDLARNLRIESYAKDAPLARWLDRRLSWRISYFLAHTAVTPNQVTIAATALGLASAWLFAMPHYWPRVLAAALFLASTTLDGVDGELARLRLLESRLGARLDTLTDNLVHLALFAGVMIGCYRTSYSAAYLVLPAIFSGGFAACAIAGHRARTTSNGDREWFAKLERLTGRDFAYILMALAAANRVEYFAWGAAFGTYVFAAILWLATSRRIAVRSIRSFEASRTGEAETDNRGLLGELNAIRAERGRELWSESVGEAAPRRSS